MSIKISRIDSAASDFDVEGIMNALDQDNIEDMTPKELEHLAFKNNGTIPSRIALADAGSFGIRKSYFDIWKPANPESKGVWKLSKEADGTEWIVQEDANNIKHS